MSAVETDDQGCLTIPRHVGQELGLAIGMTLKVKEADTQHLRLHAETDEPAVVEKDGLLTATGKLTEDIGDPMKRDREARMAKLWWGSEP